jgi:hypothetical protein
MLTIPTITVITTLTTPTTIIIIAIIIGTTGISARSFFRTASLWRTSDCGAGVSDKAGPAVRQVSRDLRASLRVREHDHANTPVPRQSSIRAGTDPATVTRTRGSDRDCTLQRQPLDNLAARPSGVHRLNMNAPTVFRECSENVLGYWAAKRNNPQQSITKLCRAHCAPQSNHDHDGPNLGGMSGDGDQDRGRALGEREPAPILQRT